MTKVSIDTSEVRTCAIKRCRRGPLFRHHKGCDHFIGRYDLALSHQYRLFLDCCDLCDHHHMVIHYMYGPIIKTWLALTPMNMRTPDRALRLRARLIAYCDKILAGKIKLQKPSKKYKRQWSTRRKSWQVKNSPRLPSHMKDL